MCLVSEDLIWDNSNGINYILQHNLQLKLQNRMIMSSKTTHINIWIPLSTVGRNSTT